MQTKREYAASLGLAKLGVRGKLSGAAHDAINKARAEGMTFSDDNAPKPIVNAPIDKPTAKPSVNIRVMGNNQASVQSVKPKVEYDSKAVRAWAKSKGLKVGERGRIHPDILNAYWETNPDDRPETVEDKRPHADRPKVATPVTRTQSTAYVVASGPNAWNTPKVIGFGTCAACQHSVNRCTHDVPVAPAYLSGLGTVSAVSLSKPVV